MGVGTKLFFICNHDEEDSQYGIEVLYDSIFKEEVMDELVDIILEYFGNYQGSWVDSN